VPVCTRVYVHMYGGHWVIGMCEEKRNMRRKKKKRGGKRERFSLSLYLFLTFFFFLFLYVLRHSKSIKDHVTCNWKKKIAIMFTSFFFFVTCVLEKDSKGEKRKDNGWEQNIKGWTGERKSCEKRKSKKKKKGMKK